MYQRIMDEVYSPLYKYDWVDVPDMENVRVSRYYYDWVSDIVSEQSVQRMQGNTPLFIAEAANNKEAVKLLIEAGANTTIKNKYGVRYNEVIGLRASPLLKDIINKTDNLNKEKTTDIPRQ